MPGRRFGLESGRKNRKRSRRIRTPGKKTAGDSEYDGREDDFQEKAPAKKKLGLFGRKKKEKEAYDEEPEYEEAEYDERPAAEASRKPAPKPEVLKEEAASLS